MDKGFSFIKRSWFHVLVGGGVLFFGAEQSLRYTGNPNLFPTVILLGALVIPIAFVAYFYGQERLLDVRIHGNTTMMQAALCFVVGGAIGVIAAGVLEYATLNSMNVPGLLAAAVIEEVAKLIFPLILFIRGKFRSEIDGLLFGTATGMGFAALETMGYGMVALIVSRGNINALEQVLVVRGVLSPLGHAAWTGLICAVIWRTREQTGKWLNSTIVLAFISVVALHVFWNLVSSLKVTLLVQAGYVAIGGISLFLLIRRLNEAKLLSNSSGKEFPR